MVPRTESVSDRALGDQVTRALATEIANTPLDSIPATAMAAAKRLLIDHVGITYMGAAFTGSALHAYAREIGGRPEAVVIGTDLRVPAELAAGINAQICRNTDFEETGPGTHVGPLCVHTALAVGQRVSASGRAVLGAIALGYALCARFHFARGSDWPRTSMVHHRTVAAAIAARLLGQDAETTARTLSLAWEIPPRTHQAGGAQFIHKRISPLALSSGVGAPLFGARNGVQAAVMAQLRFESVPAEIDHHMQGYDIDILIGGSPPFHHVDGQMELKPWVCSRHCQCGIQALANLVREHAIDARKVTGLRLRLSNMYQKAWLNEPAPRSYWEAIYSTQWAAAMVLQGIPAGPKWVSPERLNDEFSRNLAAMVEITEDPAASQAYWDLDWLAIRGTAEVDVGGTTLEAMCTMRETWGSPGIDMPDAMVQEKFMECTSVARPSAPPLQLLEALRRIEAVENINEVARLM